jgi:hypothetical protein
MEKSCPHSPPPTWGCHHAASNIEDWQ